MDEMGVYNLDHTILVRYDQNLLNLPYFFHRLLLVSTAFGVVLISLNDVKSSTIKC